MNRRLSASPVTEDGYRPREGTADARRAARRLKVVGNAGTAAPREVAQGLPDVVLLDISKPGDASEASQFIARGCPTVRTITLSFPESERYVAQALAAAAKAYLPNGTNGADVLNAIVAVSRGASYVMVGIPAHVLAEAVRLPQPPRAGAPVLTDREVQILAEVSRGLTNKEIARKLLVREKTIKNCMTGIMQKLKVRNRVEAVLVLQKIARGTSLPNAQQ